MDIATYLVMNNFFIIRKGNVTDIAEILMSYTQSPCRRTKDICAATNTLAHTLSHQFLESFFFGYQRVNVPRLNERCKPLAYSVTLFFWSTL